MKKWLGWTVAALLLTPLSATAGDLRLTIANGRVTLVAQDVPLKQIFDEWARVGQTMVVGAERLVGPPVTIELQDVVEARALEMLLRTASGYIAKPRLVGTGVSRFDRILIMPPSKAPAASAAPAAFRQQPQVYMPNVVVDDDPEPTPVMPPGMQMPQGAQPFQGQPFQGQPPMTPPGQQPVQTSPRPGMLPPPTPGMPFQPGQQPVRPPGTTPGPGGLQDR